MIVPEFLFIDEVATLLKVDHKTVRRRIASGSLRAIKEGGRLLVLVSELKRYMSELEKKGARR